MKNAYRLSRRASLATGIGFGLMMVAFALMGGGPMIGGRVEILGSSVRLGGVIMGVGLLLFIPSAILFGWGATEDPRHPR